VNRQDAAANADRRPGPAWIGGSTGIKQRTDLKQRQKHVQQAIGIDIGGTRIKAVALSAGHAVLDRCETATVDEPAGLVAAVAAAIERLSDAAPDATGVPVGLAAPGLAADDERSIAWMQGRLEAVQGLDWTAKLGRPVRVLNDAQSATLAEASAGAATGCRHVVMLTLGTGVGGGAIVDGQLLRGALGRAGHLGHICLNPDGEPDIVGAPGSLEDLVGDHSVAARTGGRFADTRGLAEAVRQHDQEATRHWQRTIHVLACGIVSLINALDPQRIVIGGGIAQAGPTLFDPLRAAVAAMEWRPTGAAVAIVPATLGADAGAIGAARYAMAGDQT